MDTTAAAEVGEGKGPNDSGSWSAQGWSQQGYPPLQNPKVMNISGGEWPVAAPSITGYGFSGQEQARALPYASEPQQKKMRTSTGDQQEGYEYPPGKDYQGGGGGDTAVAYAPGGSNDSQGVNTGYWYGAGSGSEVGYVGAANGGWYSGYAPGMAASGYATNPSMAQHPAYGSQSVGYNALAYGASANTNTGGERGASSSRIFHKTRLCTKFSVGACTFGERCNFAHGMEDVRKRPRGWEGSRTSQDNDGGGRGQSTDGVQGGSVGKTRLCRNYYSEGTCPYGDTCSFLHDVDGLHPAASRDPSALSGNAAAGAVGRPSNWKTQICRRWGATGQCSFGENCHFAHGASELRIYGGTPASVFSGSRFPVASSANASADGKISNGDCSQPFGDGVKTSEIPLGTYGGTEETTLHPSNHLPRSADGSFSGGYSTWPQQQNVPFYYASNNNVAYGQNASSGDTSKDSAHKTNS